jgi:anti-anti-sigma regulatory factor
MQINQEIETSVVRPQGHLGIAKARALLNQINGARAGIEFDFSEVESIDVSILQIILVVVASMRQRGWPLIVNDSESGVLRSTLLLAGIRPELAGLSAGLAL